MTYLQAANVVLQYTDRPLSVGELTAVAVAQGLIHPRGRTPDRSMSSVLYRHLLADPNAAIVCEQGRFWLRGRAPAARRHLLEHTPRRTHSRPVHGIRRPRPVTSLPLPPFSIPLAGMLAAPEAALGGTARAVARLDAALSRLQARQAALLPLAASWDAEQTRRKLVDPLLTELGYRRADRQAVTTVPGRSSLQLMAGETGLLLECTRAGQEFSPARTRAALECARSCGLSWLVLTNGLELRLYRAASEAPGTVFAAAPLLRFSLTARRSAGDGPSEARGLWLLSRPAVIAGSLRAYLAARVVGAALLEQLDDPESPLLAALGEAIAEAGGPTMPLAEVALQARLAVRRARGRDGEPLPEDLPALVAAGGGRRPRPLTLLVSAV
jgi:hypothetical protein